MNEAKQSPYSHMQKTEICADKTTQKDEKQTNLKSWVQFTHKTVRYINYRVVTQMPVSQPTLQRSSKNKDEIIITREQLDAFIWLYRQYGLKKPGWLRQKFYINRLRRSKLNRVLNEAGCVNCTGKISHDMFGQLHTAWHLINRSSLCTA